MLFYIDKTIAEAIEENRFAETHAMLFSEVALSSKLGHCFLCGHIDSITKLALHLGKPISDIYKRIIDKYAEFGGYLGAIKKVFVLSFAFRDNAETELPDSIREKSTIIAVDDAIHWKLGMCSLLCEQLSDCRYYKIIGNSYLERHDIKGIGLHFMPDNGGGSTIGELLENRVRDELVPTLCIVDSDRKYGPMPQMQRDGDTLKCIKESEQKLSRFDGVLAPHEVYPLDVHEIENLIPVSVLETLLDRCPEMRPGIEAIKSVVSVCNPSPAFFYDYKNGFVDSKTDSQKREYWEKVAIQAGKQLESVEELTKAEKHISSKVFPPVAKHVLNQVLNEANGLVINPDPYLEGKWDALGAVITAWGVANLAMRA